MSVWAAIGWGAFASASLYVGQALAAPLGKAFRHGGNSVGLLTVLGYLAAAALTVVQ